MDIHKIQINFFFALLISVLIVTGLIFWPFATPIALAFMFAVLLRPLQRTIRAMVGNRGGIAAAITILLLMVVVIIPLFFLGATLFRESFNLYSSVTKNGIGNFDQLTANIVAPIQQIYPEFTLNIEEYISNIASWFISNLGTIFSGGANILFSLFIGSLTLFYLLRDGSLFRKTITELSPLADSFDKEIIDRLERAVSSVVKGSLLICVIQGVLTTIGFYLFGIQHAVLWGSIAAVAALVPGFGTSIVVVPGIIFLFLSGSTNPAIGLTIWSVVIIGLVDNFLMPTFVGKKFQAHPMLILFGVLGGIFLFGPIGVFMGPLVIALLLALIDIYKLLLVGRDGFTNKI